MAGIVNLRRVRKAKARAEKEALAAKNRVSHGRTKVEKDIQRRKNAVNMQEFDGKLLE